MERYRTSYDKGSCFNKANNTVCYFKIFKKYNYNTIRILRNIEVFLQNCNKKVEFYTKINFQIKFYDIFKSLGVTLNMEYSFSLICNMPKKWPHISITYYIFFTSFDFDVALEYLTKCKTTRDRFIVNS